MAVARVMCGVAAASAVVVTEPIAIADVARALRARVLIVLFMVLVSFPWRGPRSVAVVCGYWRCSVTGGSAGLQTVLSLVAVAWQ